MLDITVLAPEDAGISAVAAIKAELSSAMEKASPGSTVVLDIGAAKKADSSLAQLIMAFKAEAASRKLSPAIRGGDGDRSMTAMLCCDAGDGECALAQRVSPRKPEARHE